MAPDEDRENVAKSSFDAQSTSRDMSLDAARACFTKLLDSRTPHDRQLAIEEIDKHVAIIEASMQSEGDSASTTQAKITELKVLRNAALPIHTLPREILSCIFLVCLEPITWRFKNITRLMSVCAVWKELLENASVFWPKLHSHYSPEMLELILSRNVSGPLRVICSKKEDVPTKLSLLERATKHSTRWCSLAFEGLMCDVAKEYIQVDTPNLTELYLFNSEGPWFHPVTLTLSEGKPFRHVVLHGVGIPWDTSRLRGLRSLQLSQMASNPPSLSQLRTVLASSPGLWYLRLSEVRDRYEYSPDAESTDSSSMLFLPELSSLVLQTLSERFMSHLLTHIQAPALRCLVAADIPFSVASDLTFNNLIAPALRISKGVSVSSSGASIFIYSSPRPQIPRAWIDVLEETVGIKIAMRRGASGVASKADVQSILNTVMAHTSSGLAAVFILGRSPSPIITPPEVLRLLPSANLIVCEQGVDCQEVMRFLITGDGEGFGLPCPQLESLRLSPEEDSEVELIRDFLRLHHKNAQEKADTLVRPLKSLFLPQNILDRLEAERLLEGLEARCPS
ncbi:hypothetical protein M407DRAFT_221762 [Tulasnella calospora MUT 4182]|uniref:F-box domain-containing protein n=1 Tax=Tulasnella calospora MUT 4182 TaxID=1051891 RepID=A0A0C3PXW1_9AGAM|nr:hypothetical protein M407DRAFT_221762 [Tulasnella calospora MUT 4182]